MSLAPSRPSDYVVMYQGTQLGKQVGQTVEDACKIALRYLAGLVQHPVAAFMNVMAQSMLHITHEELTSYLPPIDGKPSVVPIILDYLNQEGISKKAEKLQNGPKT